MDFSTDYICLINDWGLSSYTQRFFDEGITDESFPLLDIPTITHIIDKAGPRLVFMKKFKEYLKGIEKPNSEVDLYVNSPPSCSLSTATTVTLIGEPSGSSTPSSIVPLENSLVYDPDQSLLEMLENSPKKLKKSSVFSKGDLESLLNTTDGRVILLNKYKLNNDLRQKLCKIIINDLLCSNQQREIARNVFIQASEEVTSLFLGEQKDLYYVPYSSAKTGLRMPARGKLWSRYVNVKAALRNANQSINQKESKVTYISDYIEDNEMKEAEKEVLFLKTGIEPQVRVLGAWEKSFKLRYKLYFKNSKIDNLYEIFPCLKSTYGLELLETDFNHMYPHKIDAIYETWNHVTEAILKEAKERKINLPEYKDKSTQAVLILPFLFTPVTLKKNVKDPTKNWRPTRREIQYSFFFHAKDSKELEEITLRRKSHLDKINLPLQPFGVVINFDFFIIIHEVKYKCDSCVRTIELLYKAFHALNLEYPTESKHIWQFIEEIIFSMPVANKSTSTTSVISDIKFHLKT